MNKGLIRMRWRASVLSRLVVLSQERLTVALAYWRNALWRRGAASPQSSSSSGCSFLLSDEARSAHHRLRAARWTAALAQAAFCDLGHPRADLRAVERERPTRCCRPEGRAATSASERSRIQEQPHQ